MSKLDRRAFMAGIVSIAVAPKTPAPLIGNFQHFASGSLVKAPLWYWRGGRGVTMFGPLEVVQQIAFTCKLDQFHAAVAELDAIYGI